METVAKLAVELGVDGIAPILLYKIALTLAAFMDSKEVELEGT